jgi:hypothetical protein
MVSESGPIWDALQAVWKLKKTVRADIAAERAAKAESTREHFRKARDSGLMEIRVQ